MWGNRATSVEEAGRAADLFEGRVGGVVDGDEARAPDHLAEPAHGRRFGAAGGTAARQGTAWKVQYARGMHKGLYITGAWFKRALEEPWMQVLHDARIAELIDSKAGLAARALDGWDEDVSSSADVQLEALVALLTAELSA